MTRSAHRPSPLATVLLALLMEAPMHAYRMQQLIKERSKDSVVNVARSNSVYQTIDRLRRADLIQVRETRRTEGHPDRIVFEITEHGRMTLHQWLDAMLSTPAREFPEFPAALATLSATTPSNAIEQLETRVTILTNRLVSAQADLSATATSVPRLFLLEEQYRIAMIRTELQWIRSLIVDLRSGKLTWTREWLNSLNSDPPFRGVSAGPVRGIQA